ncbi:MAG TPA: hypothetical protein DDZ24_07930, partial [Planctomycetaceae bacterium]|nr:hypothetical protein [Planctomycetaceae bacterium]
MSRLDSGPGRVPPPANFGKWRQWSLLAVILISCLAGYGLSRIRIDDDLRSLLRSVRPTSLFSTSDATRVDEEFALIDAIGNRFGAPDRDCIIRVNRPEGDIFDEPGLSQLRSLVKDLEQLPDVSQVRSMFEVRRQGVAGALLPVIP